MCALRLCCWNCGSRNDSGDVTCASIPCGRCIDVNCTLGAMTPVLVMRYEVLVVALTLCSVCGAFKLEAERRNSYPF